MSNPAYWITFGALVLSCYFAACAAALRTFSRTKLAELLEDRGQSAKLEGFLADLGKLLLMTGTLRTGLNLVALLSILWLFSDPQTAAADTSGHRLLQYCLAFVVAGCLISVCSVAIPVSVARYHREPLLARSMGVLGAALWLFMPFASALGLLDPIVRRIIGNEGDSESADERLTEEILSVVEDHNDQATVDEDQKDMLEGVIELRSTTAGQVMTPRTTVKGIEADATLMDVKRAILDLGHSRIPVYRENLDHIIGILYAKDMIKYLGNGQPWDFQSVVREAFMVPESKPVNELLAEFKSRKVHIAIVLDEYGGTAGLVTIEDILEEIVGEIQDEYEPVDDSSPIQKIDEHTAEVDARLRVNDLNDELDLELPEHEDYDTIGGFVFSSLGHIPEVGESFEYDNVRVTVSAAERTRVSRVRLEISQPRTRPSNGNGR